MKVALVFFKNSGDLLLNTASRTPHHHAEKERKE